MKHIALVLHNQHYFYVDLQENALKNGQTIQELQGLLTSVDSWGDDEPDQT